MLVHQRRPCLHPFSTASILLLSCLCTLTDSLGSAGVWHQLPQDEGREYTLDGSYLLWLYVFFEGLKCLFDSRDRIPENQAHAVSIVVNIALLGILAGQCVYYSSHEWWHLWSTGYSSSCGATIKSSVLHLVQKAGAEKKAFVTFCSSPCPQFPFVPSIWKVRSLL